MISFPVVNSKAPTWTVTDAMIADWQADFPHLDVEKEVRKMHAWCEANVSRRKTAKGMPRFIVAWLMRQEGTGDLERRVTPRHGRTSASSMPTYSEWICPHVPHCRHRKACAIVAMRPK